MHQSIESGRQFANSNKFAVLAVFFTIGREVMIFELIFLELIINFFTNLESNIKRSCEINT